MNSVLWFVICVFVVCLLGAGALYGLWLLFMWLIIRGWTDENGEWGFGK